MRATVAGLGAGLLLALAPAASAEAQPELRFADGPRVLTELPFAMYAPRFLAGDDASETWDYAFYFAETGYVLFAQYMVTSLGPGDHRGAGLGWIFPPNGGKGLVRNSRKRKEWTLTADDPRMRIKVGSHICEIAPPHHVVQINHGKRGTFQIEAEAVTAPFRIGRLDYGGGKFLDVTVLAPRLKATGMVRMPGERPVDLGVGVGVAVHTKTNQAERKRMLSSLRFDTFTGERQVSLFELTAPAERGYQRLAHMLLLRDGEIEHHTTDFDRSFAELVKEQPKPRYPVPGRLLLERADGGPGDAGGGPVVTGAVDLELLHRDDIIKFIKSGVARWFAKRKLKSRPIGYRFRGDAELRFGDGDGADPVSGVGLMTMSVVKQPPPSW